MKHAEYRRIAPTTGAGITAKTAASFGKNARAAIMIPVGIARLRLVVPVARESPMLLETVV
jgi:hypothetical protein